jgi:hypothetical protein
MQVAEKIAIKAIQDYSKIYIDPDSRFVKKNTQALLEAVR